jgi:hypothetical protein
MRRHVHRREADGWRMPSGYRSSLARADRHVRKRCAPRRYCRPDRAPAQGQARSGSRWGQAEQPDGVSSRATTPQSPFPSSVAAASVTSSATQSRQGVEWSVVDRHGPLPRVGPQWRGWRFARHNWQSCHRRGGKKNHSFPGEGHLPAAAGRLKSRRMSWRGGEMVTAILSVPG